METVLQKNGFANVCTIKTENIIIHRGTHQTGGCATEIRNGSTRILIDFGTELPDADGNVSPDILKIDGLNCGKADFDGVFLTHYHGDHIGLVSFIPESIPVLWEALQLKY